MAADSTAMTVEYLRARLLSERSLSRTARQRADQLAKRVAELEDQLRIVTKQRKKAEKAAIEVLSILETQGLNGDFSEVIDSSSDLEEIPCEQKGSHDHPHAVKEDDTSNMSKPDASEVDDALSESESQISPTQGRSKILSWKGVNRPASLVTNGDKKIDHNRQRQGRSFLSAVDSFPRHPLGKSCRKIKRKEMGCAVENGKNRPDEFQHLGIKEHDTDDDFSNNKDKIDDQTKYDDDDDNIKSTQNGVHKDEEMEQALEKQARLILRYQAEEDSQREWEEKFKENNVSSKDATRLPNGKVCDENEPNSVNDPTSDGPLDEVSDGSEAKNTRDSAVTAPNESVSHGSSTDLYNSMVQHIDEAQQADEEGPVKLKKSSQEFEFSGKDILCTRVEDQGIMGVKSGLDSRGSSNLTLPINSPSYESRSSDQSNLLFLSGRNDNSGSSRLGHVLETLHSAKLSLMQELNRSPTQNHSNHNQNHTSGIRSSDIFGSIIPGPINNALENAHHHILHQALSPGIKSYSMVHNVVKTIGPAVFRAILVIIDENGNLREYSFTLNKMNDPQWKLKRVVNLLVSGDSACSSTGDDNLESGYLIISSPKFSVHEQTQITIEEVACSLV